MEQRNGRIDRKLQRSPEVQCHYFVFRQRPEDRVLEVLVKKTKIIEAELGSRAAALRSVLVHMLLVMHVRRRSLRSVPLGTLRKGGRLRKGKRGRHCKGDGENTLFHFFSPLRAFCGPLISLLRRMPEKPYRFGGPVTAADSDVPR